MSAITFINKKTQIPSWVSNLHEDQPRSYAYKKDGFCISLYGKTEGLFVQSVGLTASQFCSDTLESWANTNFAAENIEKLNLNEGEVISGVWRPGLYCMKEINQALGVTDYQRLYSEQALQILIEKLYDIFLYIEPSANGLQSYSHKTRELLILAATEVENIWKKYMKISGVAATGHDYKTADYIKLLKPLCLADYEIILKPYAKMSAINPFISWSSQNPTSSLNWYNAYNKTKHDREAHFGEATLGRCIEAVAANIALFCVSFGPYSLYEGNSITSSHFNQLFSVRLVNPDPKTFYVPIIRVIDRRHDFVCGHAKSEPWMSVPLTL